MKYISVVIKNMDMKKDKKYLGKNMYSAKIYETVKQNYMSKLYVQYLEFFKE
jgi:hypothetical protein